MSPQSSGESVHPIILYDGVCGLCNRLNQFVLKRDRRDIFRFAALQSELARAILEKHGRDTTDLDAVYVVADVGTAAERVLPKSEAILYILRRLGGVWRAAGVAKILPRALRDVAYNLVARNRYRIFGKYDSCLMPSAEHRAKFLDV